VFLLDTVTLSESQRRRPDPHVMRWLGATAKEDVFISVLTVGEIQKGISKREGAAEGERLLAWWRQTLPDFQGRILDVDIVVASTWGEIAGTALKRGRPLAAIDALIAATALRHGLTVVTRNLSHFLGSGVPILNPWEPEPEHDPTDPPRLLR
jgi:predicted nucleic acid-binding protein